MEAANKSMKKSRITTLDELFGLPPTPEGSEAQIQEIELNKLHEFQDHPFKVLEDQALMDMVESIKQVGQITPAIVRPLEERPGEYELVSGNRRHKACILAGMTRMKVIVKEMTRDEAIVQMVDANLQRETILPSERGKAYKMKLEAMKRQAGRPSKNYSQLGNNFVEKTSSAELATQSGESKSTIFRFIRLTELVPPLLEMVDSKRIALNPAVELSYLSEQQQHDLCDIIEEYDCTPSLSQAQRLKEASKAGKLERNGMELVMQEEKPNQRETVKVSRDRFKKYFSADISTQKIEEIVEKALDMYFRRLERQRQEQEYSR